MKVRENISETDLAKMAAYIDGEGCICISEKARNYSKTQKRNAPEVFSILTVSNTDVRLIEWCKQTFGCGTTQIIRHKNPKHRTSYNWHVRGFQAEQILTLCYPYFTIKREQADIVLSFRRTFYKDGKRVYYRYSGVPSEVIEQRRVFRADLSQLKHSEVVQ